ncbi:MAG: hypothetical protein JO110_17810 [Acetobacteraceae bacterium]|nr:hypothetical protein [Acetobacteraceae bacterium]
MPYLIGAAPLFTAFGIAHAEPACVGTISGSTLGDIARDTPVALERSHDITESQELSGAFEQGFRDAGGVVDSGAPARMIVAYLLHGPAGTPGANQTFATLSALTQALQAQGGNPRVTLTVTVANFPSGTVVWVGSVVCKIQTRNFLMLAHDLGGVVARSLGRSMQDEAIQ